MSTDLSPIERERYSPPPPPSKRGTEWGKVILYGVIALVVLAPLPIGSVLEWSVMLIELAALLLAGLWLWRSPKPALNPFLDRALVWPRRLFLAFGAVVVLQIVPLPKFIVRGLSPGAYNFMSTFRPGFARSAFASLSLNPGQTLREGLLVLAYFLTAMVVLYNFNRFAQIQKLVGALIAVGVFEALFGLIQVSSSTPSLLFYSKTINLGAATGTFVNPNHFAGFLELILPLAVGLILSRIGVFALRDPKARTDWRQFIARLGGKALAVNVMIFLAILIMSAAIIRSRSRSGVFLLFFTFLLFGEIIMFHFGRARERQKLSRNFINAAFVIILVFSAFVGLGSVINRFLEDDTLFRGGRTVFWGNVTGMIRNFPLLGSGLGSFVSVYPYYDQSGFDMTLTHAHNDYLELASDVGLVGAALLLAGIGFLLFKIFTAWRDRRSMEIKGLSMGGFVAVVVILFHSLTDFNFHIPSNALLFAVILALTAVTVYHKKSI
jgi:O-antigen ligase